MDMDEDTIRKKSLVNENEYQQRVTDRILFKWRDIVRYNEELERYEYTSAFTPELLASMKAALTRDEEAEMLMDFKSLENLLIDNADSGNVVEEVIDAGAETETATEQTAVDATETAPDVEDMENNEIPSFDVEDVFGEEGMTMSPC